MNTDNRTLAAQHADSLIATIRARVEAGYPFGVKRIDTDEWYDIDDADVPALDSDEFAEDWTDATAYDYLADALDIQYTVSGDGTFRSARILISFGGPNVWIDTRTGLLEVHWGGSEYRALPSSYVRALDDEAAELWEVVSA